MSSRRAADHPGPKPGDKLHWMQIDGKHWETDEGLDGVPEYYVDKLDNMTYRMKFRSSAKAMLFGSLNDAKDYAQAQRSRGNPLAQR